MAIHAYTWTKPYHGVSHLNHESRSFRQVTIARYDSFVQAMVFGPVGSGFEPIAEKTFYGETMEADAMAWCEKQADALDH